MKTGAVMDQFETCWDNEISRPIYWKYICVFICICICVSIFICFCICWDADASIQCYAVHNMHCCVAFLIRIKLQSSDNHALTSI